VKHTVIKVMIVLVSLCCINGGKAILFTGNDLHVIAFKTLVSDFELPHQQHHNTFSEDEKWTETFRFDFSDTSHRKATYLFSQVSFFQEFSDSIWQPPEFV
jgi:hypothetical protein